MALSLDLEQQPTYWHLSLSGDLDYGECSRFRMSIDRILRSEMLSALVDLSGLQYIDSSGIGLLLSMSKQYTQVGGCLVLVTNAAVDGVLSIAGIGRVFVTTPTVEEALLILTQETPAP